MGDVRGEWRSYSNDGLRNLCVLKHMRFMHEQDKLPCSTHGREENLIRNAGRKI
jgi:hypothetical protein